MVRPDLSVPRPSLEMSIPSIVILPAAGSVILKYEDSGEGAASTLLEHQPEYGECQTGLAGSCPPHDPDPLAWTDVETDSLQDEGQTLSVPHLQVVETDLSTESNKGYSELLCISGLTCEATGLDQGPRPLSSQPREGGCSGTP